MVNGSIVVHAPPPELAVGPGGLDSDDALGTEGDRGRVVLKEAQHERVKRRLKEGVERRGEKWCNQVRRGGFSFTLPHPSRLPCNPFGQRSASTFV